jgi:EpsI family protein
MTARQRLLPILILLGGCALLATVREQRVVRLTAPLAALPTQLVGALGVDQEIGPEERRAAGTSEYLLRTFASDSTGAFSVYVGYYDSQRRGRTIHSPKNCLPGSGWTALMAGVDTVESAAGPTMVNRYIVTNGESRALVYYWYQGRGRVVANEFANKGWLMLDAARLHRTDGGLVRLMTPVTTTADAAFSSLTAFTAVLFPQLSIHLP